MSQIIKQNSNWIIIDYLSQDLLDFAKESISDITNDNWSEYTSAKGENSRQNYIINPVWMPMQGHTEPSNWPNLRKKFEEIVQRELVFYGLLPSNWRKIHACSAWSVIGEKGSYHTAHEHGPSNVCSVTYLEVPENQKNPEGQIYFILDASPYNSLSVPETRILHIKPEKGMIVIFPSWLIHGVYPQGEGIRQTLNIDFNGDPNYRFDTPTGGSMNYG